MVILSKGKLGGHVSFTNETNCHLYQCVLKYRVKGTPLSYTETYRVTERQRCRKTWGPIHWHHFVSLSQGEFIKTIDSQDSL